MAQERAPDRDHRDKSRTAAPSLAGAEKLLERVPPHDENAEIGVLGSMMIDPRAAEIAIEELKTDDFYLPRHRELFVILHELFQKTENLDELYVVSELTRRGKLEAVGGKEAIGQIIMATPTAANVESYCRLVHDRAIERELIESAGKILRIVHEPAAEGSEKILEEAEQLVFQIADKRTNEDATPMTSIMEQTLNDAARFVEAKRAGQEIESPALATQFLDLDRLLSGGLWPGELIIVAGRPSMGKTTFAINIARKISVGNESKVKATAIFSLEMPKEQVAKNILCAEANLQGHKMRRYELEPEEYERAQFFGKVLQQAPIFIDDSSGISVSQLRSRVRRLRRRHDVRLVIVDYLQLMRGSGLNKQANREQEVAEISRGLKAIARDMGIPMIVLSQLNRSAEKRENDDKRPQLSDLRESGSIEQDADVVIMLYRPEYYDIGQNANNINIGEALVLKNRNGPVGQVKLTFHKDILRFEGYVPEHDAAAGA
ncbi:MAG TPA: replicative DNA helicase [Planctomycetota bacterium]|nr:replicative DNA helicase [Planctomycetota bacterium]